MEVEVFNDEQQLLSVDFDYFELLYFLVSFNKLTKRTKLWAAQGSKLVGFMILSRDMKMELMIQPNDKTEANLS